MYIKTLLVAKRLPFPKYQLIKLKHNMIVDMYDNRISDFSADAKKYFISVKIENRYQNLKLNSLNLAI